MSERRPTLAHRAEHALFTAAVAAASIAGDRAAAAFGGLVGRIGYSPLRLRRRVAEENLRRAFPEKDAEWISATLRAAYAHLGRETLATIRIGRLSRDQVLERTSVIGLDRFQAALAAGRGLVLASGHIGNHEIGAAALAARGIPLDLVVQRQGNPLFDQVLIDARRRLGLGVIDRSKAQRLALKALRAGRAVAFAADQNAGRSGVFVPFFGRLASTHRGAALFAVKTGAPLFLGTSLRRGGRYEVTLTPVDVDRSGPLDDVVYRLTAAFTACLESVVRTAPGQYLWLHRRWKTPPPGSAANG